MLTIILMTLFSLYTKSLFPKVKLGGYFLIVSITTNYRIISNISVEKLLPSKIVWRWCGSFIDGLDGSSISKQI